MKHKLERKEQKHDEEYEMGPEKRREEGGKLALFCSPGVFFPLPLASPIVVTLT